MGCGEGRKATRKRGWRPVHRHLRFFDFVVTTCTPGILSSLSVSSLAILCASGDSPHLILFELPDRIIISFLFVFLVQHFSSGSFDRTDRKSSSQYRLCGKRWIREWKKVYERRKLRYILWIVACLSFLTTGDTGGLYKEYKEHLRTSQPAGITPEICINQGVPVPLAVCIPNMPPPSIPDTPEHCCESYNAQSELGISVPPPW